MWIDFRHKPGAWPKAMIAGTSVALILTAPGCFLFEHQEVVIRNFSHDKRPLQIDTSKMPVESRVTIEETHQDLGPRTNVYVSGGHFRVVLVPTTQPDASTTT